MLATIDHLNDFNAFARAQLTATPSPSMRDLFRDWLHLREQHEVVADMQASDEDIAAGRVTPVAEAIAEVRAKLGIVK